MFGCHCSFIGSPARSTGSGRQNARSVKEASRAATRIGAARREQALKGVAAAALERSAPDVLVFPSPTPSSPGAPSRRRRVLPPRAEGAGVQGRARPGRVLSRPAGGWGGGCAGGGVWRRGRRFRAGLGASGGWVLGGGRQEFRTGGLLASVVSGLGGGRQEIDLLVGGVRPTVFSLSFSDERRRESNRGCLRLPGDGAGGALKL